MKIIISVLLIFTVFSLYAQKEGKRKGVQDDVYATGKPENSNKAPKKTYKIIVKNELTADENFKLVGQTLVENDFTIEQKDKEFFTIRSGSKNVWKGGGRYVLIFSIKDKAISVTGQCNNDISLNIGMASAESSFVPIVNKGGRGSFYFDSFIKMEDFTLKLGNQFEYIAE